jgi:hypothetical protein
MTDWSTSSELEIALHAIQLALGIRGAEWTAIESDLTAWAAAADREAR